ncbi:MAG: hypothetical protein HYW50_03690 [Candidatus Diapherotrites archaeon]|nr:hypothetical protein [Candidatus Diapherotrites archaeon]
MKNAGKNENGDKAKKKGFFSGLFGKKEKKEQSQLPPAGTTIVKGKVKEIMVDSPLDKKFEEYRSLNLKIPKIMPKLEEKIPKRLEKSALEIGKEERIRQKRMGKKLVLLIIPSEEYLKSIIYILRNASASYSKILYISLNELYDNLIRNLQNNGIDIKNFYFIDAITRTAQTNIDEKSNCTFVTSPNSLIELSLAISQKIDELEPDLIIFDSLSTLFIYENEATAVKFVHSLIGKMKAVGCDSILTSLQGDAKREAIKDLGMFVDEFLTMSEYQLLAFRLKTGSELIPKTGSKDELLKKEMDTIFPQRKKQSILEQEKQQIIQEMKKIRQELGGIKQVSPSQDSIKKLEKSIETIERKPVQLNALQVQKELAGLRKAAFAIKLAGKKPDKKVMSKAIAKFNSKIKIIEKNSKTPSKQPVLQKPSAKEKLKLKKIFQKKKQSEKQVTTLEKKLQVLRQKLQKGKISKGKFEKEKEKIEKQMKK